MVFSKFTEFFINANKSINTQKCICSFDFLLTTEQKNRETGTSRDIVCVFSVAIIMCE